MKKIFLLSLIFLSFILTGCSSNTLSKITIDEVKEKMNKKESFVIYFASENDNSLKKNLESVLEEYKLEGYQVDINKIKSDDENNFRLLIDYSDPSIVFVVNGVDSSILSHITSDETTKKDIIKRLIDMNFITERS